MRHTAGAVRLYSLITSYGRSALADRAAGAVTNIEEGLRPDCSLSVNYFKTSKLMTINKASGLNTTSL
jgi:hypothetical protein